MKSLSQHLKPLSRDDLLDIAERAGVDERILSRAYHGQSLSVEHYLRICAAAGFDPMTRAPMRVGRVIGFDAAVLALGVKFKRSLNRHTVRTAATKMKLSASAVTRLENGHVTSIETVLKTCRYVGVHPFDYCLKRNVTRETLRRAA